MTEGNQHSNPAIQDAQANAWDFAKEYESRKGTYDRALADLETKVRRLIEDLERDGLFRARFDSGRVKAVDSIRKKAERDGIPLNKVLDVLNDIVGIRVVCNNLKDVDKVIEAIGGYPDIERIEIDPPKNLHAGTEHGYRARHIVVSTTVYLGYESHKVLAEVQVRTLLQDAWARLSHSDFYKPKEQTLRWLDEQMKELSDRLYAQDRQAQDIRGAIEKVYVDLKHTLRAFVSARVATNDLPGAIRALSESLGDQDPALQLAAVDVFLDNQALWDQGMQGFSAAVLQMSEWMKIRVADRLSNLAPEHIERFESVISSLGA